MSLSDSGVGDRWVERDLREYIMAIRLSHYPQDEQLSKVLGIVDNCRKQNPFPSPVFIFYAAAIKFIIGIGSDSNTGEYSMFLDSLI